MPGRAGYGTIGGESSGACGPAGRFIMRFTHCPHCGRKTVLRETGDEGLVPWCGSCNTPLFDIFPACIIALAADEQGDVALLRQGYISHQYYNLVSGYIKPGETAEETARREIEEEIGLRVQALDFAGTYWFGKKGMLMIGFLARVRRAELVLSGEVDAALWVPAAQALGMVHPKGSVSYALVEKYLALPRPGVG